MQLWINNIRIKFWLWQCGFWKKCINKILRKEKCNMWLMEVLCTHGRIPWTCGWSKKLRKFFTLILHNTKNLFRIPFLTTDADTNFLKDQETGNFCRDILSCFSHSNRRNSKYMTDHSHSVSVHLIYSPKMIYITTKIFVYGLNHSIGFINFVKFILITLNEQVMWKIINTYPKRNVHHYYIKHIPFG